MKVQTPSKYLPRPFLKSLLENRCISPRGIEYSEDEVTELLQQKEVDSAEQDFQREMLKLKRSWRFDTASVLKFQDSITQSGIIKGLAPNPCQAITPCELINASIIFSLPENNTLCESLPSPVSQQQALVRGSDQEPRTSAKSGGKMKFPGKIMSESDVNSELEGLEQFIDECLSGYALRGEKTNGKGQKINRGTTKKSRGRKA